MRSAIVVSLLALAACEVEMGSAPEKAPAKVEAPAAGKAEEGQLSIKAPGFDMKINIPKQIAVQAGAEENSELLYPGATLSGLHVEAPAGAGGDSGVELRFTSADPPGKIAAWYRDPARAEQFAIASQRQESNALQLSGTRKQDGGAFGLRLVPAAGGGSEGRLSLTDRGNAAAGN